MLLPAETDRCDDSVEAEETEEVGERSGSAAPHDRGRCLAEADATSAAACNWLLSLLLLLPLLPLAILLP